MDNFEGNVVDDFEKNFMKNLSGSHKTVKFIINDYKTFQSCSQNLPWNN